MSLRVWLPLNGTLDNQGLDQVTVTNNGATVDNNGKIGKCYSFNGSNNYVSTTCINYPAIFSGNFSICFWTHTDDDGSRSVYLGNYGLSGSGNWFNLEKYTNDVIRIWWNNGSPDIYAKTTIKSAEGWIHLCITREGNVFKIYKNGVLNQTISNYTISNNIPSTATTFYIGTDYRTNSDIVLNGKLNDFRIYDHTLSPLEVKQISQGLILHYPLNNNGWGQENLLINSNIEKSGKSNVAQWFRWNITDSPLVTNQYYTLSFEAKITVPTDVFYIGLAQNDSTQEVLQQGVQVISEYKRYIFTGKTTKTNINSIIISNYKNYRRGNDNNTTGTLYIKNMKLELGQKATPWCPNEADELANKLGLNDNVEYDTSGFGNNGIKVGTFDYDSDTPKYNVSTSFNGVDNCIQLENISSLLQDVFTINLWFKKDSLGSKAYETLFGGPSSFEMDTRSGSSQTLSLYMASTRGGNVYSSFNFGEWYMVTLVNDSTNELYYVNGELVKTITKKSMPSGNYFIGAWQLSSKQNYKGLISDFRIYATALSADDVKSLYQKSAYIDNQGNIYGALYEEV